ncbi:hypothetical protein [Aestuariivivens insulae]|uniref:hypothetical protein n=1 Tax=Aestuariivivens insulae TaxID=1621988 RepID=UPI001F572D24|nr:hypothetical protein [Aestuariivivens insulae]
MKNLKLIVNLIVITSSLMFFQCTSDYTAIPGQDGIDGVDGVNGVDGIDGVGVQQCIDCHASEHRNEIKDAYVLSGHATGTSWARGESGRCARCHNNEGYIDLLSGMYIEVDANNDPVLDQYGNEIPSANFDGYQVSHNITCTGCHAPEKGHRSFDFENDGNDYALRNIHPINLYIDPMVSLDMTSNADPLGLSNTCINCHQPRNSYPIPSGTGDVTITSRRFGPHHGPQSTMLEGIMGANIAGTTGYPGRGTAAHKTGASCTSCHMGETTDGTDGSHTWEPTLNTCVECHNNMTAIPEQITAWTNYQTLHDLLVTKGYISESGSVQGGNGGNASSSNPLVVPVSHAQAIWNYKTLEEDQSNGIHNPIYAEALLKNSIEALQN